MTHMRYWIVMMLLALGAGFLIIETWAFGSGAVAPIGFAMGIILTLLALGAFAAGRMRERRAFRMLPALAALGGAWEILATVGIFSPGTERWLAFANGCGILALALGALTLHELTTERVVHSLKVAERESSIGVAARTPSGTAA
jgi:hypothetical protein